jgi:hypothetical protein
MMRIKDVIFRKFYELNYNATSIWVVQRSVPVARSIDKVGYPPIWLDILSQPLRGISNMAQHYFYGNNPFMNDFQYDSLLFSSQGPFQKLFQSQPHIHQNTFYPQFDAQMRPSGSEFHPQDAHTSYEFGVLDPVSVGPTSFPDYFSHVFDDEIQPNWIPNSSHPSVFADVDYAMPL